MWACAFNRNGCRAAYNATARDKPAPGEARAQAQAGGASGVCNGILCGVRCENRRFRCLSCSTTQHATSSTSCAASSRATVVFQSNQLTIPCCSATRAGAGPPDISPGLLETAGRSSWPLVSAPRTTHVVCTIGIAQESVRLGGVSGRKRGRALFHLYGLHPAHHSV